MRRTRTLWIAIVFVAVSTAVRLGLYRRAAIVASPANVGIAGTTVETIVFLRHGERATRGCGQLNAQGFNRAIALSRVLPDKFGKPDYLFAPDPGETMREGAGDANYVRPLATIEPTAIRYEMPVRTLCGYHDVARLDAELADPKYANATIFVAWEHVNAQAAVADLMRLFHGDPSIVPFWKGSDYDSLYVVKVIRAPGRSPLATFSLEHERLDGQSAAMPAPRMR